MLLFSILFSLAISVGLEAGNQAMFPQIGHGDLLKTTIQNSPMTPETDHDSTWRAIDSLAGEGMYRDALSRTEALFETIRRENDPAQWVKAQLYLNRFKSELEEDGLANSILRLEKDAPLAPEPARSILYSVLGGLYSDYLSQNNWRLTGRTDVVDTLPESDVRVWSAERLAARAFACFEISLADPALRTFPVERLSAVLEKDFSGYAKRPYLYDVLAFRALGFYADSRMFLTEPAYAFVISEPVALASAAEFVGHRFTARDSLSGRFRAIRLYQSVISAHLNDKDPAALVDADLLRLDFVRAENAIPGADKLYEQVLEKMLARYARHESFAEIAHRRAAIWAEKAAAYDPEGGLDDPEAIDGYRKALELLEKGMAAFPKSRGAELCLSLKNEILYKSISVETEEAFPLGEPALLHVSFRNLSKFHARLYAISDEEHENLISLWGENFHRALSSMRPLQDWSVVLPPENDHRAHRTEIAAPAQKSAGRYLLVLSEKPNFAFNANGLAHVFYHHSDLAYIHRKTAEGIDFHVVDRKTGQPVAGAKAEAFVSRYNGRTRRYERTLRQSSSTDPNGLFSVKNLQNETVQLKISKGKDRLSLNSLYYNYYYSPDEKPSVRTDFFLDRGIYRPGQTVFFKGLVLHGANDRWEIQKNSVRKVLVYDANYQVIAEIPVRTNDFGTFNSSFVLPVSGSLGYFQLEDGQSRCGFRVEEYKRPKFEVVFEKQTGAYRLDDSVTVKGGAVAFAGNAIDGAEVRYRVVRSVYFPYWRWWESGYRIPYRTEDMEIAHGTATTSPDGSFSVSFELIGDAAVPRSAKPRYEYRVMADVTDAAGETHSGSTALSAGTVSIELSLGIPSTAVADSLREVGVFARNLSGNPEAVDLRLVVESLRAPGRAFRNRFWEVPDRPVMDEKSFRALFPQYPFGKEDRIERWPVAATVFSGAINTGKTESVALGKRLEAGHYRATLSGQDPYGENIEIVRYFRVADPGNATAPKSPDLFVLAPDRNFEPGQVCSLYVECPSGSGSLFFQLEHGGKTLSQQLIPGQKGLYIPIPITEDHRGNVHFTLALVQDNRLFKHSGMVFVPWSNKELRFEYLSFRDKLRPGQEEEWRIKITGNKADAVAAEVVAALYDASLDEFAVNPWWMDLYPWSYQTSNFEGEDNFKNATGDSYGNLWNPGGYPEPYRYPTLNLYGLGFSGNGMYELSEEGFATAMPAPPVEEAEPGAEDQTVNTRDKRKEAEEQKDIPHKQAGKNDAIGGLTDTLQREMDGRTGEAGGRTGQVSVRKNLRETVFFYPQLMTDDSGSVVVKFTMNEDLTRWHFKAFAHTRDLKLGFSEKFVVTQKELMVTPNAPRFLREGDAMTFSAKTANLSERPLEGTARLELFDPATGLSLDAAFGNTSPSVAFRAESGQSAALAWNIAVPLGRTEPVGYRVVATAGDFGDGEENVLPVVTNRMLVTETMPLPLRGKQKRRFDFERMRTAGASPTLLNHRFTLDFTSNPAWYAVQALPMLMEYPYECTEQLFNRFYANSLARTVANSQPRIREIFERWKNTDALESPLAKNEALKSALLEETPWVLESGDEAQQKQRIGLLFDLNRMSDELGRAVDKLVERQLPSGGFSWFAGGPDDPYMTQYLVEGIGHLDRLGVPVLQEHPALAQLLEKAVRYTDDRMVERYNDIQPQDLDKDQLGHLAIHWLYARSFFLEGAKGVQQIIPLSAEAQKVHTYYLGQAAQWWNKRAPYAQGLLALSLHRNGPKEVATKIVASLKQRALQDEEQGMYWKADFSWYWYEMPIETQSLMIEVFDEVARDDQSVEAMKIWLLKNKQTNRWETTKGTAAAVYALLLKGDNWLAVDLPVEITLGGAPLDVAAIPKEAGTGHFQKTWNAGEIRTELGQITVQNPNKNPAWGAVYWQYFEQLDKITRFKETPLQLDKKLFKEINTDRGPQLVPLDANTPLTVGDLVKVRIVLRVDREMEYVHLKDMRGAGFEPLNVLSQYQWQGGMGYFESTRDLSSNFFIGYLPKGTFVFEYPLRVTHAGDFSTGICTIQSMYAPEFTAHSEGIRVRVAKK